MFLKAHWKAIAASDFFTVEVWSWRGLVTHNILFVINLSTRRVVIAGVTTNPNEAWMLQMARNLTDAETGMLRGTRHLIVDRDTKYSNAFAERFVRSAKSECLSKLIPIGVPMLRRAMHEYMEHYHRERNHQGLANELIVPLRVPPSRSEPVARSTINLASWSHIPHHSEFLLAATSGEGIPACFVDIDASCFASPRQ